MATATENGELRMWTRTEDGSVVDDTGKVIYFSLERFVRDIGLGDCCFICGASPSDVSFNKHVIPEWILRRFGLFGRSLTLPNAALGCATAWPRAALAQQAATPVVGLLNSASAKAYGARIATFRQGLGETGYVEGQNVAIEYQWAEGQYDRLPPQATKPPRRAK